jgi:hypothetical protein
MADQMGHIALGLLGQFIVVIFSDARCAAGRVAKISMGQRNRAYRDVRHCRFLGIRS